MLENDTLIQTICTLITSEEYTTISGISYSTGSKIETPTTLNYTYDNLTKVVADAIAKGTITRIKADAETEGAYNALNSSIDELKKVISCFNSLIDIFNSWTVVALDGGLALKTNMAIQAPAITAKLSTISSTLDNIKSNHKKNIV